ncbi:MAG: hypothetical protein ABR500_05485 [Dermatophilaceae bacterium]
MINPALWRQNAMRGSAVALLSAVLLTVGIVTPGHAATGPVTFDLRVLVVDDGSPMVGAIADRLATEGQPFDRIDLTSATRPTITPESLATSDGAGITARYTGIVTPNEAPSLLTEAERAALHAYESTFKVREVAAYTWAHPEVGLNYAANPGYIGEVDGMTATLSREALSGAFGYLDGTLVLDDLAADVSESWGYLATPLAPTESSSFTPLLTAPIPGTEAQGSLIGVHTTSGHERMVITFGSNQYQQHWKVLSHGIVTWLTRGVSLSYQRNYFSAHIDDVLLPDALWSIEGNCTIGDDCDPVMYPENAPGATSRMVPADVDHLVDWQARTGVKLDMTYNAVGAVEEKAATGGTDALEASLLASKSSLRWINHTWSHPYLGCVQDFSTIPWSCVRNADGSIQYMSRAAIYTEIRKNQDYAKKVALPNFSRNVLVTGEHSGLRSLPQMEVDSPMLAGALSDAKISWVASDASREKQVRQIGPATTVPRYPMNIYYNNETTAQAVDEYTWLYTSRADGGSGICEDNAATTCIAPLDPATGFDGYIVPLESRIALGHVLGNDPRPHFAHQTNLTGDRILYPVLDDLLADYSALFAANAPIVNPTMQDAGAELVRHADWASQSGSIAATVSGTTLKVTNTASVARNVPLTVPEGTRVIGRKGRLGAVLGASYAGQRSVSQKVSAGATLAFALGSDPGFAATATWPLAPAMADADPLTPQPLVEREEATIEVDLVEASSLLFSDG